MAEKSLTNFCVLKYRQFWRYLMKTVFDCIFRMRFDAACLLGTKMGSKEAAFIEDYFSHEPVRPKPEVQVLTALVGGL